MMNSPMFCPMIQRVYYRIGQRDHIRESAPVPRHPLPAPGITRRSAVQQLPPAKLYTGTFNAPEMEIPARCIGYTLFLALRSNTMSPQA